MSRQRWSHSRLAKLTRCGEMFRREEIEKEEAPPSSAMVRGSVVHEIAALGHSRQLAARQASPTMPKSIVLREALPSGEEVADEAVTRFERIRRASGIEGVVGSGDVGSSPAQIISRDRDTSVAMSRHYVSLAAPFVDPIAVERKYVVEPRDLDIRLSGVVDLETLEPGGRRAIRDIKTATRVPDDDAADVSDQLSMYALLDLLAGGKIADVFALDFVIKPTTPFARLRLLTQETTRTAADVERMIARLNNAIAATKAGVYLANGVNTWACSPTWCRFWTTCPYVRR